MWVRTRQGWKYFTFTTEFFLWCLIDLTHSPSVVFIHLLSFYINLCELYLAQHSYCMYVKMWSFSLWFVTWQKAIWLHPTPFMKFTCHTCFKQPLIQLKNMNFKCIFSIWTSSVLTRRPALIKREMSWSFTFPPDDRSEHCNMAKSGQSGNKWVRK